MDDGQRGDDQPHDQRQHPNGSHFSVHGNGNVIVGGNVHGSVGPHESYLALCDDAYGGSGYGDDEEFVGRFDLFEAVDKFLAAQESGFFLLTGKAGLGKTAFATRLARKAASYHLHVVEPHETPATVRKHLAARLIREWRLTGQLRDGGLPLTADRESWFAGVLASAARQRDLESPGPPIVLVIDGLDEMRVRDAGETVGLPRQLPRGVFVVLTCRSGSPALDHWADVPTVEIVAGSEANLLDMRMMLEQAVHRNELAGVIAQTGHDPREVVETLLRRCAGVWIYLRFVLADLTKGRRSLDDLHDLPDNLWDYYVATILKWQDDNVRWHAVALPVLAALAASRSAMSADMLAEVIGARETSRVEAFLNGPLQAFCQADRVAGTTWYRLYHSSLRYFVAGESDTTKRTLGDFFAPSASPLRWELRNAVLHAHNGVVEYFLRRWGALEDCLPGLGARVCTDPRDTYGLEHLIWHLQHATRFDDLHLLMAGRPLHGEPDLYLPGLPRVWLRAHRRAGLLDSFAEHSRWCYGHAYARIGQAGSFSPYAAELAAWYALVLASFSSMAAAVGPNVRPALVRIDVMPAKAAVGTASRVSDPLARAEALLRLIPVTSDPERDAAVRGTLDALLEASDSPQRCMIFLRLVPLLPLRLVAEAISAATLVTVPGQRIGILFLLLQMFPEGPRERAAVDLFHLALGSATADCMVDLLVAAARLLPLDLAIRAGEIVLAFGRQYPLACRAIAVALAARGDLAEWNDIAREAVLGIRCVVDKEIAAQEAAQLACFLPRAAVGELTHGAFRLESAVLWPTVIGHLAAHVRDSAPEVLGLVRDRPGSPEWEWVIDAYAAGLSLVELAQLLAVAHASDPEEQVAALLALAPHLPPPLLRRLVPLACPGTRVERAVLRGVAHLDDARSRPDHEIRAAFDEASSIRDQAQAQKARYALGAKQAEKAAQSQRAKQAKANIYADCSQRAGKGGCARCVEEAGVSVCALARNEARGDVIMPLEGSDVGRLRAFIDRLARGSRPQALELIAEEADMLVTQLGGPAVHRLRQDIAEVCDLLE